MKIQVTLTFEDEVVWGSQDPNGRGFRGNQRRPPVDVKPLVQFCGEFFKTGQTIELEVYDSYSINQRGDFTGAFYGGNYQNTGRMAYKDIGFATNIVGEWDADKHHNMLNRWTGCSGTGHIWSGHDCGCNQIACNIFTPHELGVKDQEEGSITTHQGVTISWKRVKEEKEDARRCPVATTHSEPCFEARDNIKTGEERC